MPAGAVSVSISFIRTNLRKEKSQKCQKQARSFSYTGKITRAELAHLPTPLATATHIPLPHHEFVETLIETLGLRDIAVVGEEFAVSKDGMEMFGVIDLEGCFDDAGSPSASGTQTTSNPASPAPSAFESLCVPQPRVSR